MSSYIRLEKLEVDLYIIHVSNTHTTNIKYLEISNQYVCAP